MKEFFGRLLRVDLGSGQIGEFQVEDEEIGNYLGGASLAAHLLYPQLRAETDPLAPESPLVLLNGPLSATAGPTVGRWVICARSPATGLWGESNCGGFFGAELRFASYDGVWLEGRASEPVYLSITPDRVEIRPAKHLWGKADTYETQDLIKQEWGRPGSRVACIGRAGEMQSPLAAVLCDHGRAAGRTGMGAVLGSKNLKAIAVEGGQPLRYWDPTTYGELRSRANRELKQNAFATMMHSLGTAGALDFLDLLGLMPKRYYTGGRMEEADRVSGSTMAETILTGMAACHACVIACGRKVALSDGKNRKGPEYETIVGFGPNLLIDQLSAITRLGEMCDRFGLDTISLSNTIGLAFLLYSEGVLTAKDTDGVELQWGSVPAAEAMVRQAGEGRGLGPLLAQGSRALARAYGVEEKANQVNGLELAYHDPRGGSGMALVYATSPRGACHNQGPYYLMETGNALEEVGVQFMEPRQIEGKARNVARHQDWVTVLNSLVMCIFGVIPPHEVQELVHAAIGWSGDLEDLIRAGERAWNLKRAINCRLGLTRANDRLPKEFAHALTEGGAAGFVPDFDQLLTDYYRVRGWDERTGKPLPETLQRLGLPDVSVGLWG
ncbi:MAG: aldehyde ferredoxin oxidoreductase family protein [Anaerolineales bacterium]|jgi:aldehyde:ferredoxin oxidoreductase